MRIPQITLIFFLYGLSFFLMGFVILLELGRCTDSRLRFALRFLAIFGILHGCNEWIEMFEGIGAFPTSTQTIASWDGIRLALLGLSFLPLGMFGVSLLVADRQFRRLTYLAPLTLAAIWLFGLMIFRGRYSFRDGLWDIYDVWTRYSLAIPSALLASVGLVFQQREFRRVGMAQFGRDSLWAAIAFAWYGLIGQMFTPSSLLPPSNFLNSGLFLETFGFTIQLLRAVAAGVAAIFVIRFLRSFEVETQRKIAELQEERLEEAERREAQRGELLHRVVSAQESERQRIARELHDETGQALTAIGLGLRSVTTNLRQDPEKAAANLRKLERMVNSSLDDLQRIISDLRPSHLDDLGLAAALRWYCGELQNRLPIKIEVDVHGDTREVPAEVKTAIFRVAQEALTNVARHASAACANVSLYFKIDSVTLEVTDDGCGFDPDSLNQAQRPSWGLLGMEERASLLGGHLSIQSSPGKGTHVQVTIPFNQISSEDRYDNSIGIGG